MKTFFLSLAVLCSFVAGVNAQVYGSLYPKSADISLTGRHTGFTNSLWNNSAGDSWYYPTWAYAYGTIVAGTGDSQTFMTVSNRNLTSALTTTGTLNNFLHNASYTSYATHNIGFNVSARNCGAYYHTLHFGNGTTVGFGIVASKWSNFSISDGLTSFVSCVYSNWGYEPGVNPKVNSGRYSTTAWTRANFLPVYSLYQPSLPNGKGHSRRWKLGEFTTGIDSARNNPNRFIFTTAQSLTASTFSGAFLIKKIYEQTFLNNITASVPSAGLLTNIGGNQEIILQAGTTYDVVVQDGVNTGSCEGAQVLIYCQYYQ